VEEVNKLVIRDYYNEKCEICSVTDSVEYNKQMAQLNYELYNQYWCDQEYNAYCDLMNEYLDVVDKENR
jgi:hypothetical protein